MIDRTKLFTPLRDSDGAICWTRVSEFPLACLEEDALQALDAECRSYVLRAKVDQENSHDEYPEGDSEYHEYFDYDLDDLPKETSGLLVENGHLVGAFLYLSHQRRRGYGDYDTEEGYGVFLIDGTSYGFTIEGHTYSTVRTLDLDTKSYSLARRSSGATIIEKDVREVPGNQYNGSGRIQTLIIESKDVRFGDECFYDCYNLTLVKAFSDAVLDGWNTFNSRTVERVELIVEDPLNPIITPYLLTFDRSGKVKRVLVDTKGNVIKELTIGAKEETVPFGSLFYLSELETVRFSDSITWLPNGVCKQCADLVSIYLPKNLKKYVMNDPYYGDALFSGCRKLTELYYDGTKAEFDAINIPVLVEYGYRNRCRPEKVTLHCSDGDFDVTPKP